MAPDNQSRMTGFRQPLRVLWHKSDGTPYRVDSIPHGKDPDEYAKETRRIEGHNLEYSILDEG